MPEKTVWRLELGGSRESVPRHTKYTLAPYRPVHLKDILLKKSSVLVNSDLFCLLLHLC